MNRSPDNLGVLVRTNLIISNREAANVVLSYVAFALGGAVLAAASLPSVVTPSSKDAFGLLVAFVLSLAMFDYFLIQTRLTTTTLINKSALDTFPLSRKRSVMLRFVVMMLDKRIIFYLIPLVVQIAVLWKVRGASVIPSLLLLYLGLYLVMSEILFGIFPILRKLSDRFNPRTVTQITLIPILLVIMFPAMFHLRPESALRIPAVSQFLTGTRSAISGNSAGAAIEAGKIFLMGALLAAALLATDSILLRLNPKFGVSCLRRNSHGRARRTIGASSAAVAGSSETAERRGYSPASPRREKLSVFIRLVFLDWRLRQKEERLAYMVVLYPFLATMLANIIVQRIHHPLTSPVFPVLFTTLMLGTAITEEYITRHGLKLKYISTFPADHRNFILVKSVSSWAIIVVADIAVTLVLGVQLHVGYYQMLQGILYSLYISSVTVQLANTIMLFFIALSRHPIISVIVNLIVELIATMVYVLSMLLSPALGVALTAGILLLSYYVSVPAWGRRESLEFQTLLEDSK